MKIANRTFVLSGGASGLGLATARHFLQADAYVAILDRSSVPALDESISNSDHPRLLCLQIDLEHVEGISDAVERVVAWSKSTGAHLGGVVNCAGIAEAEQTVTRRGQPHSVELWNRIITINLNGTFHLTRFVAKHLVLVPPEGPDGERGVIIMVSSTVAYEGQPGQIAYAAAKGAIRSMTLPMARDMARYGVRVVSLAPGPFKTPMTGQFTKIWTDKLENEAVLFPKRYGAPEEFASTVKWVVECPYINGETYKLTGGLRVPAAL
ncbi:hypothetical protein D9757_007492 [Collybiopsis confluens]|uniref:Ketoreductase domain-containing protein n=1 Tax=Collybiopsis confluens TaxID=2823264 RepID=A0A8H5HK23_9AGAR|nr:hypothetical protein D9757_007492 [Collybiopsis confluens]